MEREADASDPYADFEPRALDPASMLAEVEQQVDERTLRVALGASRQELDWIRAGHEPDEETRERLRLLHETSRKADLSDPEAVLAAVLGPEAESSPLAGLRLLAQGPYRRALFAFLALDALLIIGLVAYVVLIVL